MKKKLIIIGVLVVIVLGLVFWAVGVYNKIVAAEEKVESDWAQVENQYQRRSDLIPNLVETVKGYATHEQETLEAVTTARASATQVKVDPANVTPEQLAAFTRAQGDLTTALGKLLAIAENYPDLKANENFRDLQAQLEGTENRITVARNNFNESAKNFNVLIRRFPNNLIASHYGFEKKAYFEAAEGANEAPKVDFSK